MRRCAPETPAAGSSLKPQWAIIGTVYYRCWERNGRRSYLADQVCPSSKALDGFFCRNFKRIEKRNEFAVMHQHPFAHVVGFKFLPNFVVRGNLFVDVSFHYHSWLEHIICHGNPLLSSLLFS